MTAIRLTYAGAFHHVVNNAVAGDVLFRDDDDRRKFLDLMVEARERTGCVVLSYCLLGTHFHLLVRTETANLDEFMHYLGGEYAKWFRWRHGGDGHVYKRRYFSLVIASDEHLLNAAAYIARNAVAAGLRARLGEWPWDSHAVTARGGRDQFVDPTVLLDLIGGSEAYRAMVAGFSETSCSVDKNGLLRDRPPLLRLLHQHPGDEGLRLARERYGYGVREIADAAGLSPATVSRRTR